MTNDTMTTLWTDSFLVETIVGNLTVEELKKIIHGMFKYYRDTEPERLNYFASEELICKAAAHLARCALYRNPQQLYYEDPAMACALSGEEGGSGGLWAAGIHQDFYARENLVKDVETHLDQVDEFMEALDGAA